MATITAVGRARILMDLIKDATVTDATPYASVDMMAGPKALEIATNVWNQYGQQMYDEQDPPQPRDPTNTELATFFINTLRGFLKGLRAANRIKAAGAASEATERTAVDSENTTDLGADE